MTGAERIAAERQRQIEAEGWTPEHDDKHTLGEIAMAAACYASFRAIYTVFSPDKNTFQFSEPWPWLEEWDKRDGGPGAQNRMRSPEAYRVNMAYRSTTGVSMRMSRVRELEKAGALMAAEIDRILRIEARLGA